MSARLARPSDMKKKSKGAGREQRSRAVRREADREAEKLRRDVSKLVELSPGGSPERPVQLASASQVEVEALAGPCPFCGERLRLEGPHEVESHGGERLRVARLVCGACRARLSRYYRLGATLN